MNKFRSIVLCGLGVVFFSTGCAQKVQVKAIKSAEIYDGAIKNIAVLPFLNDTISQSAKIDSVLENHTIDGEKYFNVIDRVHLEKIIAEKKLNDSGLVDLINNDGSSGLKEIQTLVTGEIALNDLQHSTYLEERIDYDTCIEKATDKKGNSYCKNYRKYNMVCVANLYSLTTNLKFIKVADSKIIFAKSFSKNSKETHCADDNKVLPSKESVNTKLASEIANNLITIIAPSYVYFSVTILDDEDVDFEKDQSKQFKVALELIKNDRISKANEILKGLSNSLQNKSYTILYDLALTEEALGNIYQAYELYTNAENIALKNGEVIEEISMALKRVQQNIKEYEQAQKQIG